MVLARPEVRTSQDHLLGGGRGDGGHGGGGEAVAAATAALADAAVDHTSTPHGTVHVHVPGGEVIVDIYEGGSRLTGPSAIVATGETSL